MGLKPKRIHLPISTLNFMLTFYVGYLTNVGIDSQNSYFALKELLKSQNYKFEFTFQFSPLSWHVWSFKIQQGIKSVISGFFYVWQNAGKEAAMDYIDYYLTNQ